MTVELILRKLGEGATEQESINAYPHLTRADIEAAVNYAADMLAHEETVLLNSRTRPADEMRFLTQWHYLKEI